MMIEIARLVPARSYTWVVLPRMEKIKMFIISVVERHHREVLVQCGNVAAIDDRTRLRLGCSSRMPSMDLIEVWCFCCHCVVNRGDIG